VDACQQVVHHSLAHWHPAEGPSDGAHPRPALGGANDDGVLHGARCRKGCHGVLEEGPPADWDESAVRLPRSSQQLALRAPPCE